MIALSPLTPLGPVRHLYPSKGVAFDWTVLGAGVAAFIVVLGAVAFLLAFRQAPHRARGGPRCSRAAAPASRPWPPCHRSAPPARPASGSPLDPGRDKRSVPVRSAILGAVLAVVVVVATVVFGASLNTLVSHPALYGWNWNYEMLGNYGGLADVPLPQTATLLDHDPYVAEWSGVSFANLSLDGLSVPVLGATPKAAVAPVILSGHGFDAPNEVVLGPTTLGQLHKHLGQTVVFANGVTKPTKLVIVGTATLPTIGAGQTLHLEIGTGAIVSENLSPSTTAASATSRTARRRSSFASGPAR